MAVRIGQGIDAHQLEEGTPLIIGGVSIPYPKGSKGHSDGDVLFHAIVDAILGALALGDIGEHFPSEDNRWENADSKSFLKHTYNLMSDKGFSLGNLDATVILQQPKLISHIIEMRKNIASILHTEMDSISVKATTTDGMGFTGKGSGIAATAVILIHSHGN